MGEGVTTKGLVKPKTVCLLQHCAFFNGSEAPWAVHFSSNWIPNLCGTTHRGTFQVQSELDNFGHKYCTFLAQGLQNQSENKIFLAKSSRDNSFLWEWFLQIGLHRRGVTCTTSQKKTPFWAQNLGCYQHTGTFERLQQQDFWTKATLTRRRRQQIPFRFQPENIATCGLQQSSSRWRLVESCMSSDVVFGWWCKEGGKRRKSVKSKMMLNKQNATDVQTTF